MRIEQKNDWYIIYAEKNDSNYKIVSGKSSNKTGVKIREGKRYNLTLRSQRDIAPIINGMSIIPQNYMDIRCHTFDEKTIICIEPENGIYELYFCKDLDGLYLKK